MTTDRFPLLSRRHFLAGTAAATGLTAAPLMAQTSDPNIFDEPEPKVQRNIAGFRAHTWQPYFSSLDGGAILVDIKARTLHFWSEDQTVFRIYPTSVPLTPELTRLGRTSITNKVTGPSWAPTPSMKQRNPEWPDFIGPGPDNPLGTHALWLSWTYYRIHGTHDTRKIGRQSSNGCIGLYNEDIAELFELTNLGTQVLLI
jgi:lipoprotein-anchoring transpeptidase ErfK/SrfK